MSSFDITFCSKRNCNNLKCERNQKNIPIEAYLIRHIWQGNFPECKHWKEVGNEICND